MLLAWSCARLLQAPAGGQRGVHTRAVRADVGPAMLCPLLQGLPLVGHGRHGQQLDALHPAALSGGLGLGAPLPAVQPSGARVARRAGQPWRRQQLWGGLGLLGRRQWGHLVAQRMFPFSADGCPLAGSVSQRHLVACCAPQQAGRTRLLLNINRFCHVLCSAPCSLF